MELGVLRSYKEFKLGSPRGFSACLRYEGMETMSKQRKPARKDSEREMEYIHTYQAVGLRKRQERASVSTLPQTHV